MSVESTKILSDFIADEDAALLRKEQGDFYPSNHHLISPLVAKASKLLSLETQQRFYFHLLRLGNFPNLKSEQEFQLLLQAYKDCTALIAQGYPICRLDSLDALLVFGFDATGGLLEEAVCDLAGYTKYTKVLAQCKLYTTIPNMLKKADKFALKADASTAIRIFKVLKMLSYLHSSFTPEYAQYYNITNLTFWAMVFITLLNNETAESLVKDFLSPLQPLPRYHEHLQILIRYLDAASMDDLKKLVLEKVNTVPC